MSDVQTRSGLPVGSWSLDSLHSQVDFAVKYHVGTFRGSFTPVQAELEVADDGSAKLTGTAPAVGVSVSGEKLSGDFFPQAGSKLAAHLQSPEFFDAERTPDITFSSNEIAVSGDQLEVNGDLTIKGITLPVTAKGTVGGQTEFHDRPYFGLTLEAEVDRTSYGMNWNEPLPNGQPVLANNVTIMAELIFIEASFIKA